MFYPIAVIMPDEVETAFPRRLFGNRHQEKWFIIVANKDRGHIGQSEARVPDLALLRALTRQRSFYSISLKCEQLSGWNVQPQIVEMVSVDGCELLLVKRIPAFRSDILSSGFPR